MVESATTSDREPVDTPEDSDPKAHAAAGFKALGEAATYAVQYAQATVSGVAYSLRKLVLLAALGVVVLLIGATLIVTASALFVVAIGDAIGAILPEGIAWLGPLVVGLVGVVGTPIIVWMILRLLASSGRKTAAKHYAERLEKQRRAFSTDVELRAAEQRRRTHDAASSNGTSS
ncbi:MAG: hypothetical protein AAGI46_16500 [Planctomycetota bacterium]